MYRALLAIIAGLLIGAGNGAPHFDTLYRPPAYDGMASSGLSHAAKDQQLEESPTFSLLSGGNCRGGFSSGACAFSGGLAPMSGVSKLSPGSGVTINSKNFSPMLVYDAKNCTSASCTATSGFGETLSKVEGGTDFTTAVPTPFLDVSTAIDCNGGDYLEGATTAGDITTEDFYIEVMLRRITNSGANTVLFGKNTATAGYGVFNQDSGGNLFKVTIADGVDTATTVGPAVGTLGDDYVFCTYAVDRSEASVNGSLVTCNGVSGTGVDTSLVGSLANANKVTLCAGSTGTFKFTGHVLYAAVYKAANWFAGGAQNVTDWEAIHRIRWAKINGMHADIAGGQPYPVVATRAAHLFLDFADPSNARRHMWVMGHHWPFVTSRIFGGPRFSGYVAEPAETNRALRSEEMATSWTAVSATITVDTHVSPVGTTTADNITGLAADTQHGITQVITANASREQLSGFFAPADNNFVKLEITTIANAFAYFNVSTCTVGTVGAAATAFTEFWGVPSLFSGTVPWCRAIISFTATGAADTYRILSANADNDDTYLGDGNVDTRLWGIMAGDWNGGYVGSYIRTTNATVTKAAEVYRYAGGANLGVGSQVPMTISAVQYAENFNLLLDVTVVDVNNAGSTTLRSRLMNQSSNDNTAGEVWDTTLQLFAEATTDIYLGTRHPYNWTWSANNGQMCVDNITCTQDLSGTVPTGLDQIWIGSNGASLEQPLSMISDVKIFPRRKGP